MVELRGRGICGGVLARWDLAILSTSIPWRWCACHDGSPAGRDDRAMDGSAEDGPSIMQPTPCVPRLLALETGEEGRQRVWLHGLACWLAVSRRYMALKQGKCENERKKSRRVSGTVPIGLTAYRKTAALFQKSSARERSAPCVSSSSSTTCAWCWCCQTCIDSPDGP